MTEQETINIINKKFKTKFVKMNNEFCDYDATDEYSILEIKNRRKYFSDKLIECDKLFRNDTNSKISNKRHYYVVTDKKGLWFFNITEIINEIIKQKPQKRRCPITTDFNGDEIYIEKWCYFLKETDAKINIKL
jgi:hypothetical protein